MMWPFHRAKEPRPPEDHDAADRAIDRAQRALEHAERQRPEVDRVVDALRRRRLENHFGEGIINILKEGGR